MFLPHEISGIRQEFERRGVYGIVNGYAGGVKANGLTSELQGIGFDVSSRQEHTSLFATQVACKNPKLVTIVGGDGTLEVVVGALVREFQDAGKSLESIPPIYPCPLGTENKLAAELKLPGHRLHPQRHKRALLGLLEYVALMEDGDKRRLSWRTFRTVPINVMKVTLNEGAYIKPMYVTDFGFGISSRLVSSGYGVGEDDFDQHTGKLKPTTNRQSSLKTNIRAFLQGCHDVVRREGIAAPVSIDHLTFEQHRFGDKKQDDNITSYGGFVSTVRELLFGFSPFYAVQYGSGRAQTIIVQSHPGWLIPQIPSIYFGWKLRGDVTNELATYLEFTFSQPEMVQAAGELYRVEKVSIQVLPEPLIFVTRQRRGYLERNVVAGRKAQYF